mmetsp:Transcript_57802/g.150276  ORF Transcript_57802/g.150276 Transcript_57802/m.150276 type:complete len:349 (+) Transcript_57802:2392-3438(+)
MKWTHWSTQDSSSMCSTTCDTAMTAARECCHVTSGAPMRTRIALKSTGRKTSSHCSTSEAFSARRSRFSSPSWTVSPSISSSSSGASACAVQASTSCSTSNIHSMFRAMIFSRNGWPSGLQKSSKLPVTIDMAASMALCRTSSSAKCLAEHSCTSRGQRFCKSWSLKNSGSSSAAEISDSRVSLRRSSCVGDAARPPIVAVTPGIACPSTWTASPSWATSSTICSSSWHAADRTPASLSLRQDWNIAVAWAPRFRSPSPITPASSLRSPRAATRAPASDPGCTRPSSAGSSCGHSFMSSSRELATKSAMAAAALAALRRTGALESCVTAESRCPLRSSWTDSSRSGHN